MCKHTGGGIDSIVLMVELFDGVRKLSQHYEATSYKCIGDERQHTVGMYAMCWAEKHDGFERMYFDTFPRKRYIGQSDADPKEARCVESE